ncbi:MAG: PepSY domain-containing protein [Prolixibacteraceae bacterium]|nr:PepSY domain-containing protein [Prolixibacteraceae bacterium]
MFTFKQMRAWHKWPGILFLFPAFLISITAILLALDGFLHMDRVKINLPFTTDTYSEIEIKSMVVAADRQYVGSKNGLYIVEGTRVSSVPELAGSDIRSLLTVNDTLYISSKQGLWRLAGNTIIRLIDKDVFHVSQVGDQLLVSAGKKGIIQLDRNGEEVKNSSLAGEIASKLSASKQKQPQTLHKLVIDLHTGEAIVGKTLMPFWIAFSGIQLLLLTLTGCWFAFKKKPGAKKSLIMADK